MTGGAVPLFYRFMHFRRFFLSFNGICMALAADLNHWFFKQGFFYRSVRCVALLTALFAASRPVYFIFVKYFVDHIAVTPLA